MEREIKFRCFYRDKMYPVKEMQFHVDGSYTVSMIEMDIDVMIKMVSPDSEHIKGVMFFTGLRDKNGVEAYYGDIIEHSTTEGGIFRRVISWSNELQCTMIDNMPYYRLHESGYIQPSKLEFIIIGNLYENPELLTP